MADSQSPPATPPPPPPPPLPAQYWCYHCDKRVAVETLAGQPDVVCNECKFGFVESISASPPAYTPSRSSDHPEDATLGSQFLQVLRLLAQVAREEDVPPPPPPPADPAPSDENDFLRIEIDGWHNDNGEEDNDDEDEEERDEEDVRSVEIEGQSDDDEEGREEDARRRRRDIIRLRLRDLVTRARSEGRNRILEWADILMELDDNSVMGLEDNSIEFRFEMPETNGYIGNPGDYVDAAEYEALLQNLAEADGRRGAPPAAKSAVENLRIVEIKAAEESYVCAICKDGVNVGEFVKEMPCGHGYHGDCIVPWLAARNSCPVCRFELPTDDPDYEEERKKRTGASSSAGGGDSSNSL